MIQRFVPQWYPSYYGHNEWCEIKIFGEVKVTADPVFHIEPGYDYLYVNDQQYTGTAKFPDETVATGSIYWYSDNTGSQTGWKVCYESAVVETTKSTNEDAAPGADRVKLNDILAAFACTCSSSACGPWKNLAVFVLYFS